MLGKRSIREEEKDLTSTKKPKVDKKNLQQLLRRLHTLEQIPALNDALMKDPSATERLMQDNHNSTRESFLQMLNRVLTAALAEEGGPKNLLTSPTTTPYKRLIAWALMHDWVPVEIMGCRLAFLPLFLGDATAFQKWFMDELATNEELWLEEHTWVKYGGMSIPQWAYRLNRLDVVQFCWKARMGGSSDNSGGRFFGCEDHWFWGDSEEKQETDDDPPTPLTAWWAANVTRANFRQ